MKTRVKPRLVSQSTSVCVRAECVFGCLEKREAHCRDPWMYKRGNRRPPALFLRISLRSFLPASVYFTSLPFETHFSGSLCPVFSSSSATESTGRRQTASSLPAFLLRCHVAVHIYIIVITKVYLILSFFLCDCDKSDFSLQLSVYCKYKTEEVFTFHDWIHAE